MVQRPKDSLDNLKEAVREYELGESKVKQARKILGRDETPASYSQPKIEYVVSPKDRTWLYIIILILLSIAGLVLIAKVFDIEFDKPDRVIRDHIIEKQTLVQTSLKNDSSSSSTPQVFVSQSFSNTTNNDFNEYKTIISYPNLQSEAKKTVTDSSCYRNIKVPLTDEQISIKQVEIDTWFQYKYEGRIVVSIGDNFGKNMKLYAEYPVLIDMSSKEVAC